MNDSLLVYTAAADIEAARRLAGRLHGHGFTAHVRTATPPETFAGDAANALQRALRQTLRKIDHGLLNETIAEPDDAAIANWVAEEMAPLSPAAVGICSTRRAGAVTDGAGTALAWRRYRLEAAHRLPNVPPGHKCGRMHGHGFDIVVHAGDGDAIDAAWRPLHDVLDHACLNDIEGLDNPTSEILSRWIWRRLQDELPSLAWVSVYETHTTGCHFDGRDFRIWKEQRFESALRLAHAPRGDKRRSLHGHSYRVRLHLKGPIDDVMGWAMDYGDVKAVFAPLYWQLDHHPLEDLPGAGDDSRLETLLEWMREQLRRDIDILDRIDLFETPGCGALLLDEGDTGHVVLGTDERPR